MGNLYVTVGDSARIMTSDNGIDWAVEQVPSTNSVTSTNSAFFGVGGTTNLLIAVGTGGSVALSTNTFFPTVVTNNDGSLSTNLVGTLGLTWAPIVAPTTNDLHCVAFFGSQYFVAGGKGTILSSANGQTWTHRTTPTTSYLSGLETYSGGLVCVGDAGTILTSPDGSTWTKRTSGTTNWIYRVHNFAGQLIAVGENGTILTSANGINWSPRASGTTSWLNDIQQVTNTFFAVGNDGTVLSSPNASSWTNIGTITENSLYGAATLNGQLIVVGLQGTIIRSQIVPDLTPIDFLEYSQAGTQGIFLVSGDPDQSFILDSSTDLSTWTPGPLLNIFDSLGGLLFLIDFGSNAPAAQFFRTTLSP